MSHTFSNVNGDRWILSNRAWDAESISMSVRTDAELYSASQDISLISLGAT